MFVERSQVVITERKLHSRSDRRWSCKTCQARGTPNRIVCCLAQQMNEKLFPSLFTWSSIMMDTHKQELKELQKVRRPNMIDPTLVRAAQLSDIKVLNKPRAFVVKMFSQQRLLLLQNKVQKAILVVNHMLAHVINWIKWIGKLIVRTMRHSCLPEFKEATVKRVTKEGWANVHRSNQPERKQLCVVTMSPYSAGSDSG